MSTTLQTFLLLDLSMYQIETTLATNPNIMTLNLDYENVRDLTLCMRSLQKFPNLRILSLHGNQLKMLPIMSQLKLVTLDVTNNPLKIDNYLLDSLFSMPTLENLMIDATEAQIERILQNLPNLKTINKKKVVREKINDKRNDLEERMKNSLRQQKEKIKSLAKSIFQKFEYYEVETLSTFDSSFNEIFDEYRTFTDNVSIDTAKQGVFLYSKNKLLDLLLEKLINILSEHKLEYVANALEEIGILRKQYFDSLLRVVLQVGYDECCLEDDLGDQINTEMKNIKLRKQRLYLKEIMRLKKKINDYRTYLVKLQQQNSKHLHTLFSLTRNQEKFNINNDLKAPISKPSLDLYMPRLMHKQKQFKNPIKSLSGVASKDILQPSMSTKKLKEQSKSKGKQKLDLTRQGSQKGLLSEDQTIQLMQQFIQSKHIQNDKDRKKKQPYRTAEEYLSQYFTSKYGVKSIAVNWSLNFIRSMQIYSRENSLCQVFLKILKNKIQQSYYEEHVAFRETILEEIEQFTEDGRIAKSNYQYIFIKHFPTEAFQQANFYNNSNELTIDLVFNKLTKTHIVSHEKLLQQFANLFSEFDSDEDGALNLQQSKDFVSEFFKPKIEKAVVATNVIEKVKKKLDSLKKNKLIFSELVEIVDKIE